MEPRYKLKTAPTFDPVSIEQLKWNLHIDQDDHYQDEYLLDIIRSTVEAVQLSIGRQIAQATYTGYLDDFADDIVITLGPVDSIVSVKYYDSNNELTILDSSKYLLDNSELTARVRFLETPSVYGDKLNAVEIEFINGWEDAASVPRDIKDVIILLASERYLNPENSGISTRQSAAERLLRNYKVQRY